MSRGRRAAALDRPCLLGRGAANGRFRRNLAVAARSGDGPFTIRFADLHDRAMQTSGLFDLAIYALASRLRASWMEARATKAPRVSARFSKSLARRRLRLKQEKVRSTTQRRGRTTKPFVSSLRLTISRRRSGTFATALTTCHQPRSV